MSGLEIADDFDDARFCQRCDGEGWVVVCIDDLCHANGRQPGERCIHGDGDIPCPEPGCPFSGDM